MYPDPQGEKNRTPYPCLLMSPSYIAIASCMYTSSTSKLLSTESTRPINLVATLRLRETSKRLASSNKLRFLDLNQPSDSYLSYGEDATIFTIG